MVMRALCSSSASVRKEVIVSIQLYIVQYVFYVAMPLVNMDKRK